MGTREATLALADLPLAYYTPKGADAQPMLVVMQEGFADAAEGWVLVEGVFGGGMWRVRKDELVLVTRPWDGLRMDYNLERWRR